MALNLIPESITYRWDLDNDGQHGDAEGISASVVFYDKGEFIIGLQATDLLGRVATDTTIAYVSNVPPLVNIGEDIEADEGQEIAFAATASDPGHDLLSYEWDFGDGSPRVTGTLSPRHTYLDDGRYTVRLWVSDNDDGVTEDRLTVQVRNLPPLVDAGPDQVVDEGSRVTFKGTATDPGVLDTLSYAWDLNYNGRAFAPDVFGPTASTVAPKSPATITAALRVRDKDGAEALDTVKVTVNNVPPTITSVTHNSPVVKARR